MENSFTPGKWVRLSNGMGGYVIQQLPAGCNIHIPGKHKVYPNSVQSKYYNYSHMTIDEEVPKEIKEAYVNWALDNRRFYMLGESE